MGLLTTKRSKEALFTPGTSLMAGFRVHGGRRAGAQSYGLVRQVKATRPGHVLPQAWVSRGRPFHHQSWGLRQSREGTSAGTEQKLHAAPFSLMLTVWRTFTVHSRTSQSSGRTHLARWNGDCPGLRWVQLTPRSCLGVSPARPPGEAWSSA